MAAKKRPKKKTTKKRAPRKKAAKKRPAKKHPAKKHPAKKKASKKPNKAKARSSSGTYHGYKWKVVRVVTKSRSFWTGFVEDKRTGRLKMCCQGATEKEAREKINKKIRSKEDGDTRKKKPAKKKAKKRAPTKKSTKAKKKATRKKAKKRSTKKAISQAGCVLGSRSPSATSPSRVSPMRRPRTVCGPGAPSPSEAASIMGAKGGKRTASKKGDALTRALKGKK